MRRKRNVQPAKKAMLIVGASERETLFFSQVRKDCRYTNLTVIDGSHNKTIENVIKYAGKKRREGRFESTWVVFSFTDWSLEPQDVRDLFEIAEKKRVKLAWTNPSFPLWLLLHVTSPSKLITSNEYIIETFNKVVKNYKDTSDYLLGGEGLSLHLRLFNNKSKALINARNYNIIASRETGTEATSYVQLFADINENCGLADVTHNQKQIGLKK